MKSNNKDILREFFKSKSRIFTIITITLIGIMVYVGMNSAVHNSKAFLNEFIVKNNMYDILIEAPLGFSEYDVQKLKNLDNLSKIEYYREEIKDDILYIYVKGATKKRLINFDDNGVNNLEYINKQINKNGVIIKDAYIVPENDNNSIKNKAKLYFKNEYLPFSPEYKAYSRQLKEYVITQLQDGPTNRLKEIKKEFDDGILKIEDARSKLLSKKKELTEKNALLNEKEKELHNAKDILEENEKKLEDGFKLIEEKRNEILLNKEKVVKGLSEIENNWEEIQKSIKELDEKEAKVNKLKPGLFLSKSKIDGYKAQIAEGRAKINEVLDNKKKLDDALVQINEGLAKIDNEHQKLSDAKKTLDEKKLDYNTNYEKNYNTIKTNKSKIKSGFKKIDKTLIELNDKKKDVIKEKNKIPTPFYIINNRNDNETYTGLISSFDSLDILKYIYTSLFYFVSIFIVTTTMIRFIEEQNMASGIYRFLGYKNYINLKKYLIYAVIPVLIGIYLGVILGTKVISKFIISNLFMVSILKYTEVSLNYIPKYIIESSVTFIVSLIVIIYVVYKKQTNQKVINLLTGNSVVIGKRIILEKLWFWKKLKFSHKIFIRNIFKYKSRLIMTLLGISTCTALVYLGFSLKYSINVIPDYQYKNVRTIDATVVFKHDAKQEQIEKYIDRISSDNKVLPINMEFVSISNDKYSSNHIILVSIKDNEKTFINNELADGALVSKQIAQMYNLKEGDIVQLKDKYRNDIVLKVDRIIENYIGQFIYIKNNNKDINAVYLQYNKDKTNLEDNIVYNINYEKDNEKIFHNNIKNLDQTIILIILIACSMTVLVTYNLGYINLLERKKEISTLKVLGYNNLEQKMYIFREIVFLSIISSLIGLVLGRYLHLYVNLLFIDSQIQFVTKLVPIPFVYSIIIVLAFIIIVLIILSSKISKIEMSKALKITE